MSKKKFVNKISGKVVWKNHFLKEKQAFPTRHNQVNTALHKI